MPVNLDKPQLWKADIARSVDFYNAWFLQAAPTTYRAQRATASAAVQKALALSAQLTAAFGL